MAANCSYEDIKMRKANGDIVEEREGKEQEIVRERETGQEERDSEGEDERDSEREREREREKEIVRKSG
jgi:hypothetical protein